MSYDKRRLPALFLPLALTAVAAHGWAPAAARQAVPAKPAAPPPGRAVVEKVCTGCHALAVVEEHRDTREGWTKVVALMIENGASPTPAEREQIVSYLAKAQPPKP